MQNSMSRNTRYISNYHYLAACFHCSFESCTSTEKYASIPDNLCSLFFVTHNIKNLMANYMSKIMDISCDKFST